MPNPTEVEMPKLKLGMNPEAAARAQANRPDARVLTYREHRCRRTHRTHRAMAQCIWPNSVIDSGDGAFALVWWLDHWPSIALFDSADHALDALSEAERTYSVLEPRLNDRRHKVVRLALPTKESTK